MRTFKCADLVVNAAKGERETSHDQITFGRYEITGVRYLGKCTFGNLPLFLHGEVATW